MKGLLSLVLLGFIAISLFSGGLVFAHPTSGEVFYTTFAPPQPDNVGADGFHECAEATQAVTCTVPRVFKAAYSWDGTTVSIGTNVAVSNTPGADGIILIPSSPAPAVHPSFVGKLVVGTQTWPFPPNQGKANTVVLVNPATGVFDETTNGGVNSFHIGLQTVDATGAAIAPANVWSGGVPGGIARLPMTSGPDFSTNVGVAVPIAGSDTAFTQLTFVPGFDVAGPGALEAFYTRSGFAGGGTFGRLDLTAGTSTQLLGPAAVPATAVLPSAHGMRFSAFCTNLVLVGANQISLINPFGVLPPPFPTLAASTNVNANTDLGIGGALQFDQLATDGQGHLLVASNGGRLVFVDVAATPGSAAGACLLNASTPADDVFLRTFLDDVAQTVVPTTIGGESIVTSESEYVVDSLVDETLRPELIPFLLDGMNFGFSWIISVISSLLVVSALILRKNFK